MLANPAAPPTTVDQFTIQCAAECHLVKQGVEFVVDRHGLRLVRIDLLMEDRFTLRLAKSDEAFDIGQVFSGVLNNRQVTEHDARHFQRVRPAVSFNTVITVLDRAPRIYVDNCGDMNDFGLASWCIINLNGLADAVATARRRLAAP